jgi:predicted dehydrogenase
MPNSTVPPDARECPAAQSEQTMSDKLRVGVIGAGRWSGSAHLPGFDRSPLCELVAICDLDRELAEEKARRFSIPHVTTDYQAILSREDIDVVDVVTRGDHQDLVFETLEAGKHCLVEKPVCHDYTDVRRAHELAKSKGLKTKVGLTFRYAPAVMYMFDLIREGFIGQPFIFNGYEQNSQWLDPDNPMDKRIHKTKPVGEPPWGTDLSREGITVSSLEGYGAPTIDIGLECIGSDLAQVVGILANMVPHRRRTNLDTERERINIDDADMFMGEASNGALFSMQSSYVTVGNYPGIEARIYGSEGAIHVRLVDEFGVIQTIHTAKPDAVEFVQRDIPDRYFPPGFQESDRWDAAFYGNLVHNFLQEITDGGDANQGNFAQSARVQEIINAVALSHRRRAWVDLPLSEDDREGGQQSPY